MVTVPVPEKFAITDQLKEIYIFQKVINIFLSKTD